MRKILFKGKRVDNGEWVQGSPRDDIRGAISAIDFYDGFTDCETVEVIPETVGQFTGLTDKNGSDIFEGDIVTIPGEDEPYEISWEVDTARFIATSEEGTYNFDNVWGYQLEVIGNIHDNTDVL